MIKFRKRLFYPLNYGASLESEAKVLSKAGIAGLKKTTPALLRSAGVVGRFGSTGATLPPHSKSVVSHAAGTN